MAADDLKQPIRSEAGEKAPAPRRGRTPAAKKAWTTETGVPLDLVYGPESAKDRDPGKALGKPGEYPFTRGVQPNMYRGRLWTMRQFAGFGTAKDTNARYKYLLSKGQTGLSVAFDMPSLMGVDSDSPRAIGEVGREGVAVCSLRDMEVLFDGIDLAQVSTSMTINAPAAIMLCFYVAVAEKQGVNLAELRGTMQTDILKEYIAQKEWIFPVKPSMRIITDMMAWCTKTVPKWNPISISGYHIREAGSTAVQELAFTLADGFSYVEAGIKAGLDVDSFAPRLSFFFNSHMNFFEEIAKYRAARRIWAKRLRNVYGAKDPASWKVRFHTQTAGCSLTAQQPENNIVRTAYEALAAVLGGTQSLHTNSMDEALALPTEKSVKIALRTQQILAHETGIADTVDPLGGSWYVEWLTDQMEREAEVYFARIEEIGGNQGILEGVEVGIDRGFFQREIARSAYEYQLKVDRGEITVVGVNAFVEEEEAPIDLLKVPMAAERKQIRDVKAYRKTRDAAAVKRCLNALREAAAGTENLMPRFLDAARHHVTLGEMCDVLRTVYGEYREPPTYW
ncbi:MAG: methylmalonyl-CoA mutase family protein [Candidatus Brocadiae bacterium]|nr:methylmalonyl-CoA mutase family protein [Candidatus Brocadiia bacterium]